MGLVGIELIFKKKEKVKLNKTYIKKKTKTERKVWRERTLMPWGSAMVVGEEDEEVALMIELKRTLNGEFWSLKEEEGDWRVKEGWIESETLEVWGLNAEMVKLLSLWQKAIDRFKHTNVQWHRVMINTFSSKSQERVYLVCVCVIGVGGVKLYMCHM